MFNNNISLYRKKLKKTYKYHSTKCTIPKKKKKKKKKENKSNQMKTILPDFVLYSVSFCGDKSGIDEDKDKDVGVVCKSDCKGLKLGVSATSK